MQALGKEWMKFVVPVRGVLGVSRGEEAVVLVAMKGGRERERGLVTDRRWGRRQRSARGRSSRRAGTSPRP